MATYVNNLRLKEIATGAESGTWGTSTNTNLELIADAFGSGTEAITTNADTHTTTVADGAADEGRAIYMKYTGTLDSACTITLAPNTINKFWIIENATSGSQNIIISQGSGANITIGNGNVSAIFTDGAGGGAAVLDALADLELSATLTVAGAVTMSGDVSVGDDLTLVSDAAVLNFGVNSDVSLTHVHDTGLLLNSTMQLQFNDSSQFINAPSATVLDINATDEIELNATAVDLNGTLDVSGITTLSGDVKMPAAKNLYLGGETSSPFMDQGLTINSAGSEEMVIRLNDSVDVATGLTTAPVAPLASVQTDDWTVIQKNRADGGLFVAGLQEDGGSEPSIRFEGYGGQADTNKTVSARALFEYWAYEHDGANALTAITADGNIFAIRGYNGSSMQTKWLVDEDGDTWQSGAVAADTVQGTTGTGALHLRGDSGAGVEKGLTIADDGTMSIGSSVQAHRRLGTRGTFTSGGSSSEASDWYLAGTMIGAAGDTVSLAGFVVAEEIRTQTATESIGVIAQLLVREPGIQDNLTGDITVAASVYIQSAPTEGEINASLYVAAGDVMTAGGAYTMKEISTPTAVADWGRIYCKTDNKLYFQDGAGTEHEISFA